MNELITQMRSKDNVQALAAVAALREQGALTDGALIEASLYGANLRGADLRDANLQGATLSGVDLREADLRGADLSGADLIDAKLSGANLRHATLIGVDLIASSLRSADLRDADFSGAALGATDLSFVNFHATNLTDTSLNSAKCRHTVFVDVDLSRTRDLETVRHLGPSEVSFSTIYRSGGHIPDVFLRGCGLPEQLLQELSNLLADMPLHNYLCFSPQDKDFALRLHDALQARGIRCWLDERRRIPDLDTYEAVPREARLRQRVIACYSSAADHWINAELDAAAEKEQARGQDGIPMLIAVGLDDSMKPERLTAHDMVDFTDQDQFEAGVDRLVNYLKAPTDAD